MDQNEKENTIREMVTNLNKKGKGIPTNLTEIPELPINDFNQIIDGIKTNTVRVLRFSIAMESSLFSILASSLDKFKSNLGLLIMYGGILLAIFCAYKYSWWLLLSIPFIFGLGSKITKSAYSSAIFKSAFSSELIFCFLYFTRQISVELPQTNEHFYYNGEQALKKSKHSDGVNSTDIV